MKSSTDRAIRYAAAFVLLLALIYVRWLWLLPSVQSERAVQDAEVSGVEHPEAASALDLSSDTSVDRQAAADEPPSPAPALATPRPMAAEHTAPDGQRIVLRVVHAQTNAPIAGFRLGIYEKNVEPFEWTSDANGRIETDARYKVGIVNLRHVPLRAEPDLGISWSIEPQHVAVASQTPPQEPIEHAVRATPPRLIVEVDVYLPDGRPAPDASVTGLTTLYADPLAGGDPTQAIDGWYAEQDTNASGRARLSVFCGTLNRCSMRLGASLDPNLISDALVLDPPIGAGPWRLDLYVAGELRARVLDAAGRPIMGASLGVSVCGEPPSKGRYVTDAEGIASVEFAREGCYVLVATDPRSEATIRREIELARGETRLVDFVFEESSDRLAVRGLVVDESDAPLPKVAVWIQIDASPPVRVTTAADGSFERWSTPGEKVVVRIGFGAWEDRYEPALSDVAFGTTGIVVHRIESIERIDIPVRIVDRATLTEIPKVMIPVFDRGFPEASRTYFAADGLTRLSMLPHANTTIVIHCVGYKQREILLKEIWPDPAGTVPLVIELERGFDQHITVLDADDGNPIVGARFVHPTGRASITDARGYVHLTETEWPEAYRVEHDGHASVQWNPHEWTTWTGVVRMDPTAK